MTNRIRRGLLVVARLIAVVLIGGATYQGVATALERRDFPAPGNRIDVGGHQLHLYCTGEGTPAVILEAPATGMSVAWGWVQPEVAMHTRVCSYDRAGLGWSEAGDRPYDPQNVPVELHALLAGARVPGPYVLVGQSLGAAFVRLYATRYPDEVRAVVALDDVMPGGVQSPADLQAFVRLMRYSPWLARTGVLRATRLLSRRAEGLPEPSRGAVRAFLNRPDHLTRAGRELARWDETVELTSRTVLPEEIDVVAMSTENHEAGALLTDAGVATRVTTAIARVVEKIRAVN